MRRLLGALVLLAALYQPVFGQQAATPTQAGYAVDGSSRAAWITHRRAGQLQWLDPTNWDIRGCQTFTADAIRRALAIDIDVTLATHPSAPADNLETLPALLRDKIMAGYQCNGFPQPQVNAQRAQG